jgi:homogentisate 1,2-dioxygenase
VAHIDENLHDDWSIVHKGNGLLNLIEQDHSPFDVVAWSGNHVPYKVSNDEFSSPARPLTHNLQYDLTKFNTVNSTSVDHTDPSCYTVLSVRSRDPSTALADFLRLGPRWDVASNTFRMPYFHRNAASEFYSMIWGGPPGESSFASNGGAWLEVGHTPHGALSKESLSEYNNLVNEARTILPGM